MLLPLSTRLRPLTLTCLILALAACTKRKEGEAGQAPSKPAPTVDVTADREVARQSWLLNLAKDSKPLVELARSNEGWRLLFTGDPVGALQAFENPTDVTARLGRARAALELAEAHLAIAELLQAATPGHLRAVRTLPTAASLAPWLAFVEARLPRAGADLAGLTGDEVAPLRAALADPASPLGALLAGKIEGLDALLPSAATDAWGHRLAVRALVGAGRLDEARRRLKALDARQADLAVGEGEARVLLRDPGAADAEARYFAAEAEATLRDVPGWPGLWRAQALVMLNRPADAVAVLKALVAAPPADAPLALLLTSGALSTDELLTEAHARLGEAARLAGQANEAAAAAQALEGRRRTISGRVWAAWLTSTTTPLAAGDTAAFPADRAELVDALLGEIAGLGPAGAGADDVRQLGLVDRHVDVIQRRFAVALGRGGQPELAVKAREAAEDKAAAQGPSARNTLSALVLSARDNVAIRRPRVALKYLARLTEALPAVEGPAEILRDLLSLQAMEQGGSATAGQ
jgi:hypothetical protein